MSKDLLKKAHAKHLQFKYDAAAKLYKDILRINPNHLDANYLLGTLYAETGELTQARQYLAKAANIDPTSPYIKVNLGNVCKMDGDYEAAREFYQQALKITDDLPQAYFGLGNIIDSVDNDTDRAFQYYQKALQLNPNDAMMLQMVAKRMQQFNLQIALEYFQKAAQLNPRLPGIAKDYGIACVKCNKNAQGAISLRQAVLLNKTDATANYFLSIAEGKNPDKKLHQDYAREEFDPFALVFDKILIQKLEYSIPEKIICFLSETFPDGFHFKSAADLGCGTGLFGIAVRNHTEYLSGLDISTNMLRLAKDKNCYDTLHEGDLITILSESDITYDLFAATDVLIYIGDLDELLATIIAKALPGAFFVFSTETLEGEGFILQSTGRYAHSPHYIQSIVTKHNCSIVTTKQVPLRKEFGTWIMGDLFIIKLQR